MLQWTLLTWSFSLAHLKKWKKGAQPTDSPTHSLDSTCLPTLSHAIIVSLHDTKDIQALSALFDYIKLSNKAKQEFVIHKDQGVPLIPKRDQKGCFFTNMHDI